MASSSAHQNLDANIEPASSPPTATGSSQDPPDSNPPDVGSDIEPPSSPPTATGSSQDPPDPNPPDVGPDIEPPSTPPTATGSSQDPPDPNPPDVGSDQDSKQGDGEGGGEEEEEEEEKEEKEEEKEEEAECGFCLFMKGGGCKDQFIAWESCVEEAEKSKDDVAEKCFEVTSLLKKCMDAHADYYEPILRAEQAMSDSVAEEAEKESLEVEETIIEVDSEKDTGIEEPKVEN